MLLKTKNIVLAGVVLVALAGCSAGSAEPAETTGASSPAASPSATPTATATAEPAEALVAFSDEELAGIFSGMGFVPDEFASTSEVIGSVYPGLTASDPSCLTPFGLGWDENAALSDAALEFGTSSDRSMTAVVSSSTDADVASTLVAEATDALSRCADSAIFEMQGVAVQTQVEVTEPVLTGTDEALGWTVTGSVGGGSFTLVGLTARVGGNTIALVGWDPETSEEWVPMATQGFVDEL